MVSFKSPLVAEQDLSAHLFLDTLLNLEDLTSPPPTGRCAQTFLARHTWHLHVGVVYSVYVPLSSLLLVGSTLRLLTTSGMSSEGIDPTSGRCGSVTTRGVLKLAFEI